MAHIKYGNRGRQIPNIEESGGSSLPSVTSSDAGKVLSVNSSGEWAAEKWVGYDAVIFLTITEDDGWILSNYSFEKGGYSTIFPKVSSTPRGNAIVLTCVSMNVIDSTEIATAFPSLTLAEDGEQVLAIVWAGDRSVAFLIAPDNSIYLD